MRRCIAPRRVVVATSVLPGVGVDPCLEAKAMDVVRNGLHPTGPLRRVDRDIAGAVTRSLPPTLVDVDVLIAGGAETARDHGVRLLLDNVVIDLRGERIPRRPAHRRPRTGAA